MTPTMNVAEVDRGQPEYFMLIARPTSPDGL